jgi:putative Ca2+/H+ antiporter (TMEM165/GDT1 family)
MMNWPLFLSIFTLIFFAELPDKTAFATLMLASRGRAVSVFIGVAAAFFIQCVVALFFGSVISYFPAKWVHLGTGLLFLAFAAWTWRAINSADEEPVTTPEVANKNFWQCAWQAFLVIFIAEWGDLTQIATATMAAKYQNDRLTVFIAAVLALWTVTAIAVLIGKNLERIIAPRNMQKFSALLFLAIGLFFIFDWLKG